VQTTVSRVCGGRGNVADAAAADIIYITIIIVIVIIEIQSGDRYYCDAYIISVMMCTAGTYR